MRRPTLREVGGNGFFHTPFCFGSFYFFLGEWLEVYVCKYILIYILYISILIYVCVCVFNHSKDKKNKKKDDNRIRMFSSPRILVTTKDDGIFFHGILMNLATDILGRHPKS